MLVLRYRLAPLTLRDFSGVAALLAASLRYADAAVLDFRRTRHSDSEEGGVTPHKV
jgi:hypothetical protein